MSNNERRQGSGRRMSDHIVKAAAGVLAGAVVGWVGNALTLAGRVEAIEKAVLRIEVRLEQQKQAPAKP